MSFHSCQLSWNIFNVVLDCLQGGRNAWPEWGYKFKGGMVWNHVTPGMPWCSRLAVVASQIFFWEEKATVEDWAINTLSLSVSVQEIYALKILDLQLSGKYVADKAKLSCRALKFLQLMAPKLWPIEQKCMSSIMFRMIFLVRFQEFYSAIVECVHSSLIHVDSLISKCFSNLRCTSTYALAWQFRVNYAMEEFIGL